ncbi:hypothetical protein LBMAG20_15310 [Methylocystaceae bacterium]|nr:hypothetical protein LBMAG20_15310 [Methylocystaceae bacterium]
MEFPKTADEADDSCDAFMRTEEFCGKISLNPLATSLLPQAAREEDSGSNRSFKD